MRLTVLKQNQHLIDMQSCFTYCPQGEIMLALVLPPIGGVACLPALLRRSGYAKAQ
jgi:hypothetical protein